MLPLQCNICSHLFPVLILTGSQTFFIDCRNQDSVPLQISSFSLWPVIFHWLYSITYLFVQEQSSVWPSLRNKLQKDKNKNKNKKLEVDQEPRRILDFPLTLINTSPVTRLYPKSDHFSPSLLGHRFLPHPLHRSLSSLQPPQQPKQASGNLNCSCFISA